MENKENQFYELQEFRRKFETEIESALHENIPAAPRHIESRFATAAEYALFPAQMRSRALLTLLSAELVGGNAADVIPAAAAVEYVHAASMIFGDLPCMDRVLKSAANRAVHERFGEGLAILVGLGLLNAAYPLVFVNHTGTPESAIRAHAEFIECIGAAGVVGAYMPKSGSGSRSEGVADGAVRELNTSAVLRLAMRTGAILSGANYTELAGISRFAESLGNAFQINEADRAADLNGREIQRTVENAKRVLIEEFDSGPARSCLIQMADSYTAETAG